METPRHRHSTCWAGHPYSDENTYTYTDRNGVTRRYCRACRRERVREYRARARSRERARRLYAARCEAC